MSFNTATPVPLQLHEAGLHKTIALDSSLGKYSMHIQAGRNTRIHHECILARRLG